MSSPPRPLLQDVWEHQQIEDLTHWHEQQPVRWVEPDWSRQIAAVAAWLRRVLPWVAAAVALWGVTMIAARVVVEMWGRTR